MIRGRDRDLVMFTGIIEATARLVSSTPQPSGRRMTFDLGGLTESCSPGASVALSGVCLTVVETREHHVGFDVVPETLDRTSLGKRRVGEFVNVERSLRLGDRLDGHFVQGHVDGVAEVERIDRAGGGHVAWFRGDASLLPFLIPKGSVAIEGVSLTIAAVSAESFSVALIPTTLERTNLSSLQRGDPVNIETDIIARAVAHQFRLASKVEGVTRETLQRAGYV